MRVSYVGLGHFFSLPDIDVVTRYCVRIACPDTGRDRNTDGLVCYIDLSDAMYIQFIEGGEEVL